LELLTHGGVSGQDSPRGCLGSLSSHQFMMIERAATSMHVNLQPLKLEHPPYDFAAAFATLAPRGAQMVQVLSSPYFSEHRAQTADLAIRHRLPTMFIFKSYVEAGGLMPYGVDQMANYRRTVDYVAKILNGAKPADDGFRMPARSLGSQHARWPVGRRSKAAGEQKRGTGARLSAGAMGIWFAPAVQRRCWRRRWGRRCGGGTRQEWVLRENLRKSPADGVAYRLVKCEKAAGWRGRQQPATGGARGRGNGARRHEVFMLMMATGAEGR
jgi:hypothetical protein